METRIRLKIKKSKLAYGVMNECVITPRHCVDSKEKKCSEMTLREEPHSYRKFKTVNCKDCDNENRKVYEKRINYQKQKPLSLYLDGGQSSGFDTCEEVARHQTPKKYKIFNFCEKSLAIGLTEQSKAKVDKKEMASKKSLKVMILKEIELKNKRKISQNNKAFEGPEFSDVEQLFTLKKIERQNPLSLADQKKNKSFNKKREFEGSLLNFKSKNDMEESQKFSVFSERSSVPKKAKKVTKIIENKLSQVILPSVNKKHLTRPLVTLDFNEAKKIESESFIVVKHPEGQVISGRAYKKNGEIASLTKIMTFFTILKICQEYEVDYTKRMVEIIDRAEEMSGTSADILSGEKYTLEQLFYGMMLPSGNDAAVAIASEGGVILKENQSKLISSEDENIKCFIKYMNLQAKYIGMMTSSFTNPHGLSDSNNQSNPYELSLLIGECLKFVEFLKVSGTKCYNCWIEGNQGKREINWENTHKLLRRQGFIGGKTGVTVTAGPCLATIYKSSASEEFITVSLRSPKLSRRFKETRWILGLTLKEYSKKYNYDVKEIMTESPELDSDNSEDEERFDFNKNDSGELRKRRKILAYEL